MSGWNKEKLQRYIKEGRGQGEKASYIPWTKTHEFSSKGRATRIFGIKTQRIHHLHSDNQLRAFHMFEWEDNVIDIREGFPLLDVMEVIDNKENLRFDKFRDKESGEQLVLTTSFLLTIRDADGKERYLARAIKDSSELTRKITFEKLEIENRYWRAKGIEWRVITDKQLSRQFVKNIEWVRETLLSNEQSDINKDQLSDMLLNHYLLSNPDSVLRDSLRDFDKKTGASNGTGLYLYRYLIAKKAIRVDMSRKFDTTARIIDLLM
ncbi:TnsA endonuclease N-terminal domain-containing protein [Paenibacillus xylanilyticus]|uniref:Heteromeric transposase endonuclease subunit TnsA n=1 Tax=Paenibacillus xylanilyticus TaxID=248903 RepID=A0A7Y6BVW6_9BACL|nr:TnsA endonuclease N-terminal domain-containing protein [Paenibacillus xylanilyticus]NUU75095.1 heteromeric transposase endonuclease subunit TnsA [Paenibacillus xylanilyticus]